MELKDCYVDKHEVWRNEMSLPCFIISLLKFILSTDTECFQFTWMANADFLNSRLCLEEFKFICSLHVRYISIHRFNIEKLS